MGKPKLTLEQVMARYPFPFELKETQKEDIQILFDYGRALGDLPVGYGKTSIGTAVALMRQPDVTVILVPPVLVPDWVFWLNSIPNIGKVVAWDGSPAAREKLDPLSDFLVMSYGVFRKDADRLRKALRGRDVMTIVDEAQNIKSVKSMLFAEVKLLSDGQEGLLLMSGTLLSSPDDAYAYCKLTNPSAYTSYQQFRNIHVKEIDFFHRVKEWQELDLMQKNLHWRRVRRIKEEIHAHLIKPLVIPVFYDMHKDHMKLYKRLMDEQLVELENGGKIDATTAQKLYHASQQIITNWGAYAGDETKVSAVFDLVDQVCEQLNLGQPPVPGQDDSPMQEKVVFWTLYKQTSRTVLAHLQGRLKPLGKKAIGAWSEQDSRKAVQAFCHDPDTVAMAAQPGSVGFGFNPQYVCRACGYIELPTRTIGFIQSSGRFYREGQKYQPLIWLFVARDTIQEALLQQLQDNDDLVNRVSGTIQGIRNMIFPRGK